MKHFFHKSGLIMAVILMVSIIFTLCGIAVFHDKTIYKPISGMSSEYIVFYPSEGQKTDWKTYVEEIKSISVYSVKGIKLQDGCGVDCKNSDTLKLVTGRTFTEQEYQSGANVTLVREDMLQLCSKRGDTTWFSFRNVDYEVVGVFVKGNSNDSRSSKFLINLYATGLHEQTDWLYGFYDNGADSLNSFEQANLKNRQALSYDKAENKKDIINKNMLSSVSGAISLFLVVGIVILLNIFSAIYIWLRGKRKEIVLRKMVGGRKYQIFGWLVRHFMIFVVGTFGVGIVFVKIILWSLERWEFSPSLITILGTEMEWQGIGLAFLTIFAIGFLIISIVVRRYLKKEIIQLIRQE